MGELRRQQEHKQVLEKYQRQY